jgi:hypothetical protein
MSDLNGLDYALMGRPFIDGGAKAVVDMNGLDFAQMGEPFIGNSVAAAPAGNTGNFLAFM